MTYVYVAIAGNGFILGVYSTREAAEADNASMLKANSCRISCEPVVRS